MKTYRLAGTVVNTEDAYYMEMFGIDYISANLVQKYLEEANGDDVTFNLNSGGGSVFAGTEIYTMLSSYEGRVIVNITGLSASIASVLMMGADEVNIAHHAQIMIHQPRTVVYDSVDTLDLERVMNALSSTEKSLAKVYMKKTGLDEKRILEMMFKETWMTSDEAKELGFVDNIIEEDSAAVGAESLVAMVNSTHSQLELLQTIKNQKGTEMDKSFLEKIKAIVNGVDTEVESTDVETEVKEESTEEVEQSEDVKEESTTEEAEGSEETESEEIVDTTDLMAKALAKIEELTNENKELKETVKSLTDEKETLENKVTDMDAKATKSNEIVNKLNSLLNSEEANFVTVSQETKANTDLPKGYNGIRSVGGTK